MTESWAAREQAIASLLPGGSAPDRARLLAALSAYAAAAVAEARRLGPLVPTDTERVQALPWLERPVFVCGHHRSGTTLLRDLLDGHPSLCVLPSEGTYFGSFGYAARAGVPDADADRFAAEWVCRFVEPNEGPHFLLGRGGALGNPSVLFARHLFGWQRALLEERPALAPYALLLALVAAFRDAVGSAGPPEAWVEKTPLNERYAARLARAFPGARFIQLVREPKATLASTIEAYRWADESSCLHHARRIRRSLRLALRNRARLKPRYLVVRYEDLAGAPAQEMERVREFLALSPAPALLTPTVLGRPVRSNSSFAPGAPGAIVPPRAAALPPQAATLVEALAGPAARALGYEATVLPPRRRVGLLLAELPRYARDRVRAVRAARP